MKVIIGSDHCGTDFIHKLVDMFPEIEFVASYNTNAQPKVINDADALFGWITPDGWNTTKNNGDPENRQAPQKILTSELILREQQQAGIREKEQPSGGGQV